MSARWQDRAACRGMDPDLFFPPRGTPDAEIAAAKAVCASCPVREECLAWCYSIGAREGIWGGTTERGRRSADLRQGRYKDPAFEIPGDLPGRLNPTAETERQRRYRDSRRRARA